MAGRSFRNAATNAEEKSQKTDPREPMLEVLHYKLELEHSVGVKINQPHLRCR